MKNNDQIRTYELLKRYTKVGKRRFDLEDYRYKLAYSDDIYPSYAKLKQCKIKPTIKAINENTDIEIYELKEIRYGRKVGAIEFYVRNNSKENITNQDDLIDEDDIIDIPYVENVSKIIGRPLTAGLVGRITNLCLESIRINSIDMTVYEYIKDKVEVVEEYSRNNTVYNYMGVLMAAIKDNWGREGVNSINTHLWNEMMNRDYSEEEYKDIENKLLGWDN